MRSQWRDVCLAVAATESFLPGAMVTISSFLARHPRFGGGIVLFHDGIAGELQAALGRAFVPLRFEPVRPALRERLANLAAAHPALGARLPAFYSLESFRISGYRKVLYCDCDLLFRRSIDEIFEAEEALLCSGDRAFLGGQALDPASYLPVPEPLDPDTPGVLERTFNTGLMLIDARLTGEAAYSELLALVTPEGWLGTDTLYTDQLLLNRYCAGRQTLISATYNYRLHLPRLIRAQEGLAGEDAKVLHFAGALKPWMPATLLRTAVGVGYPLRLWAYRQWYEAWLQCLADAHLRGAAAQEERPGTG